MKKTILKSFAILGLSILLTSCFSQTYTVGTGAQSGIVVKEKNHYLIGGLAPLKTSSPTKMAAGAKNYEVNTQHSFVDGLINLLTFGLYTPTTTKVTK